MHRFACLAVLLTSLYAAAANTVTVRSVSVSNSNTYTIEGLGFSPKKGAPSVTINGLRLTVKSFSDTRIVGTLATPPAGDCTLKITNSQGHSTTFEFVVEPPQKADSSPDSPRTGQPHAGRESHEPNSSDRDLQRFRAEKCQVKEVTPGMPVPSLPSFCFER